MRQPINHDCRRLLGTAALSVVFSELTQIGSAQAQADRIRTIIPGANTSLAHNLPQDAPQAFAQTVVDVDRRI